MIQELSALVNPMNKVAKAMDSVNIKAMGRNAT